MKRRFVTGTMLIVVLALLISTVTGAFNLSVRQTEGARQSLRQLLSLMDAQTDVTQADTLAESFSSAMPNSRLTIVDPNGRVLKDTDSDTTEDHRNRPEIQAAMESGWGEITRSSATLGYPMLYVAKRFSDGVVVRAAIPLSSVEGLIWDSIPPLLLALVAALCMAFALSRRMARHLVKPLNCVGEALRDTLYGHAPAPDSLTEYESEDELRPIIRSIQLLIERLQSDMSEIKAERDKVKLILDCMGEGLLLLDEEDGILAINSSARALIGLSKVGEGSAPIFLRSQEVRAAIAAAHDKRAATVLDIRDPLSGSRDLRLFISPVSGQQFDGRRVGTSVLISDVTELKKAEAIRSEFTANVSHELKTPLTSIRGAAELLSKGLVKAEDQEQFYTLITVETERLISLINDILELSELESVAIDRPRETASPLQLAREVEAILRPEAGKKNVAIYVSGDEGDAVISPDRLKELLMNLMENAVRYGKENGGVEVKITRADESVTITVRDDGIGIPDEALPHIFERFYRVDKSRSKLTGGTGLGLAIVKHICQLYHGGLKVESELGKGTTFTVTLPAQGE